jgi:hypothetical protein
MADGELKPLASVVASCSQALATSARPPFTGMMVIDGSPCSPKQIQPGSAHPGRRTRLLGRSGTRATSPTADFVAVVANVASPAGASRFLSVDAPPGYIGYIGYKPGSQPLAGRWWCLTEAFTDPAAPLSPTTSPCEETAVSRVGDLLPSVAVVANVAGPWAAAAFFSERPPPGYNGYNGYKQWQSSIR